MKVVELIRYQSFDGKYFNNEKDCVEYETEMKKLKEIEKIIGEKYLEDGCNFSNGGGYIQHSKYDVLNCWRQLLNFYKFKYNNDEMLIKHVDHALDNIEYGPNKCFVGRIIDGTSSWSLYSRLMCINFDTYREYGQPYFAINPDKAQNFNLR